MRPAGGPDPAGVCPPASVLITAARVWDGTGAEAIPRGFVRMSGGVIDAVGRQADLAADPGCPVVELGAATLLPGLVNTHTHLTFSPRPTMLADYLRERQAGLPTLTVRAVENLRRALAVGVTTIRDCGTVNKVAFTVCAAVEEGLLPGPRVLASGRGVTTTGGHCWYVGIEADTADEVRKAVRAQVKAGADLIKIFATGGHLTPGTNPYEAQYSPPELAVATTEARRLGRRVAAHAHGPDGIRAAVAARVDTVEHCSFGTPAGFAYDEAAVAAMAAAGIVVVPTVGASALRLRADPELTRLVPPAARQMIAELPTFAANLRRMRAAGVTLVSGSDAGIPGRPFDGYPGDVAALCHRELSAGMNPVEALRSATGQAAAACGLDDTGVLAPGKRADLLGVAGDPLNTIDDLSRVRFVACAGRIAVAPPPGPAAPPRPTIDPG